MEQRNDSHEIDAEDVLEDALAGATEDFDERTETAEPSHVHIQRPSVTHD